MFDSGYDTEGFREFRIWSRRDGQRMLTRVIIHHATGGGNEINLGPDDRWHGPWSGQPLGSLDEAIDRVKAYWRKGVTR